MLISDLLNPERVMLDVRARSKKRVLELAAANLGLASDEIEERTVYSGLCGRERIGTTALGHGVALPHCRLKALDGAAGSLLRLSDPVDFDSSDGEPVDLVFALMVPESQDNEHLKLLALLAETFSDTERRELLRQAASGEDVLALLESWELQQV